MTSATWSPVGSRIGEPDTISPESESVSATDDSADLDAALRRLGLLDATDAACWTPLAGGVSSDIWRVVTRDRTICVKRARPALAVAAEWHVPVERNRSEVAWLEFVHELCPGAVPRVLGHLPDRHLFAMEYLDPARFHVWKQELAAGRIEEEFAAAVGTVLGRLHAYTAHTQRRAALAERFATDDLFHSLRIEPYLDAAAAAHPDLARELGDLAERTAATRLALVHGDVSPKNLLAGPAGPVFLDAECAWFGDPAFDVAFCLTHLLLKSRWLPTHRDALLRSFNAFVRAHAAHVDWEPIGQLETRVATLLPALLLARVDGKSPVEYLTNDSDRDAVRDIARELLIHTPDTTDAVRNAWQRSLPT